MSDAPGMHEPRVQFGGDPPLEVVLAVLREFRPRARHIGVELVGVVGSVARGDAGKASDIDVVFDASGDLDYWKLGGLMADLEDRLGRRIDVVDRELLRPESWAWMSRDLVPL